MYLLTFLKVTSFFPCVIMMTRYTLLQLNIHPKGIAKLCYIFYWKESHCDNKNGTWSHFEIEIFYFMKYQTAQNKCPCTLNENKVDRTITYNMLSCIQCNSTTKNYFTFIFQLGMTTSQKLVHIGQRQRQTLSLIFIATKCGSRVKFTESAFQRCRFCNRFP